MSLFERLGGEAAFEAAVAAFYTRMLADERVARFFADVDTEALARKQRSFLMFVTGGPTPYEGRGMRAAHSRLVPLGLSEEHVDIAIEHLGATLLELGVAREDVREVAAVAESVRDHILGREPRPAPLG